MATAATGPEHPPRARPGRYPPSADRPLETPRAARGRRTRLRPALPRLGPAPAPPALRRQHRGRDPRLLPRRERRQDRARRGLPRPVRRHRLPVAHRRRPQPDRRPRGPLLRHRLPGQRPALPGDALHLRRSERRPHGRGQGCRASRRRPRMTIRSPAFPVPLRLRHAHGRRIHDRRLDNRHAPPNPPPLAGHGRLRRSARADPEPVLRRVAHPRLPAWVAAISIVILKGTRPRPGRATSGQTPARSSASATTAERGSSRSWDVGWQLRVLASAHPFGRSQRARNPRCQEPRALPEPRPRLKSSRRTFSDG